MDIVKTSRMNFNTQYTVDEAFSNRKICMHVTWETITDSRQRELVQYKCELIGTKEFYEATKERQKELRIGRSESDFEYADRKLEFAKYQVIEAEKNITRDQQFSNFKSESTPQMWLRTTKETLEKGSIKEISRLGEMVEDKSILEMAKELDDLDWVEVFNDVDLETKKEYEKKKQALRQAATREIERIDSALQQEKLRELQEEKDQIAEQRASAERQLEQRKIEYEAAKIAHTEEVAKLKEELAANLKAIDEHPLLQIESAREVYQWIINGEEIELVWGGIEKLHKDGKITRSLYLNFENRPETYLDRVYQDRIETYPQISSI